MKKLSLTNFGFDDVETITMCLNPGLESLRLDQAAIGFERIWSNSQVDALVSKLFQLPHLVSLSLSGIPITDSHVRFLLPRFNNQLKCLHLRGDFGDPSCSPLTDNGVKAIAEFCPSINHNYMQCSCFGLDSTVRVFMAGPLAQECTLKV